MHDVQELISISQASDTILENITPLDSKEVSLENAHGRILAETVSADRPIPPYHRAMMDGIAISWQSYTKGQRAFPIAATQAAGAPALQLHDPATCLEIMTGAPLPHGTDTIIKIEDITTSNNTAHISPNHIPKKNQHIHPLGSDQQPGNPLIQPGTILNPPELAIAASVGHTNLLVTRIANILLITTGDEVIPPQQTPEPHQIRGSHAHAITAAIEPRKLGKIHHTHIPDTQQALLTTLEENLQKHDLILITGGISMGKFDHVAPVLQSLIGNPLFHGVAQRPGKPLAFWKGKNPIVALPGNPVSVMACLARYILPALKKMRGESWKPTVLPLAHDTAWNAPFPGLLASSIFENQIHPSPPRNSGDYTALAATQGICQIPTTTTANAPLKFYPW